MSGQTVKMTVPLVSLAAAAAIALPAAAHVTLKTAEAPAGTLFKAVLRVGHGCEGSATHTLVVQIPPGFSGVRPMPKAGWRLSIAGDTVRWEATAREHWLAHEHYDEFVLRGRTPDQPQVLWFKTQQLCEHGEWRWEQVPASGTSVRGLKAPAAPLEVKGAAPAEAHKH